MCFNFNAMTNATKKIHHVFGLVVRVAISGEPRYSHSFCLSVSFVEMGQPPGLAMLYLFLFLFRFVFIFT